MTDISYIRKHCLDGFTQPISVVNAFCWEAEKGMIEREYADAARMVYPHRYGLDAQQVFEAIVYRAERTIRANAN